MARRRGLSPVHYEHSVMALGQYETRCVRLFPARHIGS